jgi:hypothetical protein
MAAVTISDANTTQGHTSSGTSLSVSAGTWYDGSNRPVGSLLLAHICITSNNKALSSFTPPSGWTLLTSSSVANFNYIYVIYRVVTGTETGAFTATLTSATAQICSYGIFVTQLANPPPAANILSSFVTTASATMTATLTAPANSVAIGVYNDITEPTTLSFSGTQPVWENSGNVGLQTTDTSGGVACNGNASYADSTNTGSGTAIANASTVRTHPIFNYVVIPSATNSYTNSVSDTVSTFSESRSVRQSVLNTPTQTNSFTDAAAQNVAVKNALTQTDSFSSSVTQGLALKNSPADTVDTFSDSPASKNVKLSTPSETAATFSESRAVTQAVKNNPTQSETFVDTPTPAAIFRSTLTQVDSFASSATQNVAAKSAPTDTVDTFSSTPTSQNVKLATAADRVTNFAEAKSQIASYRPQLSETGVTLSDLAIQQLTGHAALTDRPVNFADTVQQSVPARATVADRVMFISDVPSSQKTSAGTGQALIFSNADRSGSISAANTAQSIMAANTSRSFWRIQNRSNALMYFDDTGANATANSNVLLPGASYISDEMGCASSSISIFSPLAGAVYVAEETSVAVISGSLAVPANYALTSISGTITTGGTAQTLLTANANLCYVRIQNRSNKLLWINDTGGNAAPFGAGSYFIFPGCSYVTPVGGASNARISIYGATTGQAFVAVYATLAGNAVTITDHSSTITNGGTAQPVINANPNRNGWRFQNLSQYDMWLNDEGNVPNIGFIGSYRVPPKHSVEFSQQAGSKLGIQVYCINTAAAYSAGEW